MSTQTLKPDEAVAEILGRWSVTDLREQTDADLAKATEKFYNSTNPVTIVRQGKQGIIQWWHVVSGGNAYECRRYKNFAFCSCRNFFFTRKMCKHLAATTRVDCANCHDLPAKIGKYCRACDQIINHFQKYAPTATWTPLRRA